MAEVKKINDQYTIKAPTIIIDGDLQVLGTRTESDVQDTTINDNTIILNSGETGAGITFGTSGIEIERGSFTNVSFVYDETDDKFKALDPDNTDPVGAGLARIQVAEPGTASDAATKNYVDNAASGAVTNAAGSNTEIQFNNSGPFGASPNLTWDGTTVNVTGNITSTSVISSVNIEATGILELQDFVSPPPSAATGKTKLYAGTPGTGGTGLFFQNTADNDELVGRRKAIVYGIIF